MEKYVIRLFDVAGYCKVYFQYIKGDQYAWTIYPEDAKVFYDKEEADDVGYELSGALDYKLQYRVVRLEDATKGWGCPDDAE